MADNTVVRIQNLSKLYKLFRNPIDRLKESLNPFHRRYSKDFYALNDVSLSIDRGETVGIIGVNGSGKSTLLKILSGVLGVTSGNVSVDGKISALLELGAGFNNEYTGIENIYLNGTIMGYSKKEIDDLVPKIVEFADIGDFIDQPVKTYSSGMFVRLAFATQIYSNPDILIVDEALSVGDMRFQQKCYRAMGQMMKDKTVILVSHDPGAIAKFCSRVIWLHQGQIMFDGNVEEGLNKYQTFLLNNMSMVSDSGDIVDNRNFTDVYYDVRPVLSNVESAGSGDAKIISCGLFTPVGKVVDVIEGGQKYIFAMNVEYYKNLDHCIVGLTFKDRLGSTVFCVNSFIIGRNVDASDKICQYQFVITMPKLNQGEYTISPAIAVGSMVNHKQICWLHDAWVFSVRRPKYDLPGVVYWDKDYDILMKGVKK